MKATELFTALAAIATLAACDKNEGTPVIPQDNLKDTPITVTAGVAELKTRAGYEGTSVLPETFYLSIDQTIDTYDYKNVLMKYVDGAWKGYESDGTTEKQLLWANGTDNVTVTAATFSLDGAQTLTAEADQSSTDGEGVKKSDHLLMATDNAVMPSPAGISVNFSHLMSKVLMTITLGDEFDSQTNPITDVRFMGTVASNSYTAGTGWAEFAADATATDITPLCNAYTAPTTDKPNAVAEYEVILVPQTVAANGFIVAFSVGDRVFKWASAEAVTLESGYKYTLALKAGKDLVSSTTFTASVWNAGNSLDGSTE